MDLRSNLKGLLRAVEKPSLSTATLSTRIMKTALFFFVTFFVSRVLRKTFSHKDLGRCLMILPCHSKEPRRRSTMSTLTSIRTLRKAASK